MMKRISDNEESVRRQLKIFFNSMHQETLWFLRLIEEEEKKLFLQEMYFKKIPLNLSIIPWIFRQFFYRSSVMRNCQKEKIELFKIKKVVSEYSKKFLSVAIDMDNRDLQEVIVFLIEMEKGWYTSFFPEKYRSKFFHLPSNVREHSIKTMLGDIMPEMVMS